ncbi:MAG: hypothetical protein ACJ8C4_05795 [Gemmataceae bacterium]
MPPFKRWYFDGVPTTVLRLREEDWFVPGPIDAAACVPEPTCQIDCDQTGPSASVPPEGYCSGDFGHANPPSGACSYDPNCIPHFYWLKMFNRISALCSNYGTYIGSLFTPPPPVNPLPLFSLCGLLPCLQRLVAITERGTTICRSAFDPENCNDRFGPLGSYAYICCTMYGWWFQHIFDNWANWGLVITSLDCLGIAVPEPPLRLNLQFKTVRMRPGAYRIASRCRDIVLGEVCTPCPT